MVKKKPDYKLISKILLASVVVNMIGSTGGISYAQSAVTKALQYTKAKLTEGRFVDDNSKEVSNVVTKYSTKDVTKYYNVETGDIVSEEEKVAGATYVPIQTVEEVPEYFGTTLTKTEYGSGDKLLNFGWTKITDHKITLTKDETKSDIIYRYSELNKAEDTGIESPVYTNPTSDIQKDVIDHVYGYAQDGQAALVNVNNEQTISIKGNFINNFVNAYNAYGGGAIDNEHSTITNIEGDFINNRIGREPSGAVNGNGGAIFNGCSTRINADGIQTPSVIENITGNFIGNSIISKGSGGPVNGGAIFNGSIITNGSVPPAKIGNISGDFIGNYLETANKALGGAIYNNNYSEIGNIQGNFVGNGVVGSSNGSTARGGAIYNETYLSGGKTTTIGDITGDFIGNFAIAGTSNTGSSTAGGAAIYNNQAVIGNIIGDFIGNYSEGYASSMSGGAIYSSGSGSEIQSITGDFISNTLYNNVDKSSIIASASGGGIYASQTKINSINGNFYNNVSKSAKSAYAGAIYLLSAKETPTIISGDFVNNSAQGTSTVQGGAIYNSSDEQITEIKNSNFYNNYAKSTSTSSSIYGGAILTRSDLKITADNGERSIFKGNYTDNNGVIDDNAIYVYDAGKTLTLTADNNSNLIFWDNIKGNTSGYNVVLTSNDGSGVISLYNDVVNANIKAENVTVDFADNIIRNYDILSLDSKDTARYNIDVSLQGNGAADTLTIGSSAEGSVVKLGIINVIDQYAGTPITVQILKSGDSNIKLELSDNFIIKQDVGEVVYNDSIVMEADAITLDTTSTEHDSITIQGQVYDALDSISSSDANQERSFIFETADKYTVKNDLSEVAEGTLNIQGMQKENSVIDGNNHTLFELTNDTTLNIDNVTIENAASVINGTNPNAVVNISNANIVNNAEGISSAGEVNVSGNTTIANNGNGISLTSENASLNLDASNGEITIDDKITGTKGDSLPKLSINNGTVNLSKQISDVAVDINNTNINLKTNNALNGLDVNVKSESTLNYANNAIGNIAFNSLTLNSNLNFKVDVDLANETMDTLSADYFNANGYKVNVSDMNLLSDAKSSITEIPFADENTKGGVTTTVKEVAYSPIYKYGVSYDDTTGNFTFERNENKLSYEDVNPAVMVSPVAAQMGGYLSMIDTYNNAFNNMDMRMLHPASVRTAQHEANKYAISDTDSSASFTANETNTSGVWVRPFASYDSVGLKHGPSVRNFSYGTFLGGDTVIRPLKNGGEGVLSTHISYLGNHQKFAGNSIYQNGGNAGITGTYYKGNFFSGLSVNAGASVAEASTMYGHEDFPMIMAGIANKTGYNFEFKEGKFIIQPSMLLSYTFVNTFDYTSAAGLKMNTDNLHAIQIQPNLKFALNTKNNWQPYLAMGMNWNIMNSSQFKANAVQLPELSVKPYFQYGVGIQKTISDNFTAFGQLMIRNGGRNGVSGTFGMKWLVGRKDIPKDKNVQNTPDGVKKTVLKSQIKPISRISHKSL